MSIRRNTFVNVLGSIVPTIVSLAVVPAYLHRIGEARYGVIAVVWLVVGYSGLFDFGLSRATANQIAKSARGYSRETEEVFWTGLILNGLFGVIGGVLLFGAASFSFKELFKVPPQLVSEIVPALPWIAVAVPMATLSGVLTGTLEGRSQFVAVNAIQTTTTILTQVVPLVVAYAVGPRLNWLIAAAVLSRGASGIPLLIASIRSVPVKRFLLPSWRKIRSLSAYGSWVAVTNLVGPVLDTADRLLISGTLGVQSVTFYSIPYSLATKISLLPTALSRTLFPILSFEGEVGGKRLAESGIRGLCAILTPVVIAGIFLMHPFLGFWVGAEMAIKSSGVGEIILAGVWMNSLAFIPYAHLQGQSRPDIVAKLHLVELLPFIGVLWLGLHFFGLIGAAIAWSLRVGVDALLLFLAAKYGGIVRRQVGTGLVMVLASCGLALAFPIPSIFGIGAGLLLLGGSTWWAFLLDSSLRQYARRLSTRITAAWKRP